MIYFIIYFLAIFMANVDASPMRETTGGGKFALWTEIGINGILPTELKLDLDTGMKILKRATSLVNNITASGHPSVHEVHRANLTISTLKKRNTHLLSLDESFNLTKGYFRRALHGLEAHKENDFEKFSSKWYNDTLLFFSDETELTSIDLDFNKGQTHSTRRIAQISNVLSTHVEMNTAAKEDILHKIVKGELSNYLGHFFNWTMIFDHVQDVATQRKKKLLVKSPLDLLSSKFYYKIEENQLRILILTPCINLPMRIVYKFKNTPIYSSEKMVLYQPINVEFIAKRAELPAKQEAISISNDFLIEHCSQTVGFYLCDNLPRQTESCGHGLWTENFDETLQHCSFQEKEVENVIHYVDGDYVVTANTKSVGQLKCTNSTSDVLVHPGVQTVEVPLDCTFEIFGKIVTGQLESFAHLGHQLSRSFYMELSLKINQTLSPPMPISKSDTKTHKEQKSNGSSIHIDLFGNISFVIAMVILLITLISILLLCTRKYWCNCYYKKKS